MARTHHGSSLSVLVADDDPAILNIVSKILQLHGFFVFTANDGDSALKLFEEVQPGWCCWTCGCPAPTVWPRAESSAPDRMSRSSC